MKKVRSDLLFGLQPLYSISRAIDRYIWSSVKPKGMFVSSKKCATGARDPVHNFCFRVFGAYLRAGSLALRFV